MSTNTLSQADIEAIGNHVVKALFSAALQHVRKFMGEPATLAKEVEATVLKVKNTKLTKNMRTFLTFIKNVSDGDSGVPRRVTCQSLGISLAKWDALRVEARDAGYIKKISPTSRGSARWILTDTGRLVLAN